MIGEGSGIRLYRFIIAFSSNLLKKNGQQKKKKKKKKNACWFSLSPPPNVKYYIISRLTIRSRITEQTNKEIPDPASDLKLTWSSAMLLFKSNTWNMQKKKKNAAYLIYGTI